MKTVNAWNVHVLKERMKGNRVDMDAIITDYIERYQNVKESDIRSYVYKKIGDDYRSPEFTDYIHSIIKRKVTSGELSYQGSYYSIRR